MTTSRHEAEGWPDDAQSRPGGPRFTATSCLLVLLAGIASCAGPGDRVSPVKTRVVDLGPLTIDGVYTSMMGPFDRDRFEYGDMDWIVGFETQIVDPATGVKLGDELFCHSQLQLDNAVRLIVNATGVDTLEFPPGFGLPLRQILRGIPAPWRGVFLMGMVLNNHEPAMNRDVLVRVTIHYMDFEDDVPPPGFKQLYKEGLAMTRDPNPGASQAAGSRHHADHGDGLVDGMSQHWIVPPGEQITRRRLSSIVPADGRVHYALVHLHNYGVYMRLTDTTTGEVLWQTEAVYEPDRVQIEKIPTYSSSEGFPIHHDHEYEIETLYRNTTDGPVDAMAMMYLFYHPSNGERVTYPEPPPGRVQID